MQNFFQEAAFIHAHLKKARRPLVTTESQIRLDSEEQALVQEVREATIRLQERQDELRNWRALRGH